MSLGIVITPDPVDFDLECEECGRPVRGELTNTTISVEPCDHCINEAVEDAKDE